VIKVVRLPKPKILVDKANEWLASWLSADTKVKRDRAERKYQHREIKKTLVQMFSGKCAYCESKITHIDYGHIEHFRPKRGANARPDLVFEWTNLLLACGICNGTENKSDRFPEDAEGGPLVNPCDDDPADHFSFHFDPVAKLASVYGKTGRGVTTEKVLGLNRAELRDYRSRQICRLAALALYAASDAKAAALFHEAKQPDAEYAAFARSL
jgi:uncharacterized protein (TIGR02646 family)